MNKRRVEATLTLTNGRTVRGSFFLGDSTLLGDGPERVDDLLNTTPRFFPFECFDNGHQRVVLYSIDHVTLVTLFGREAREVPGYEVARVRTISLILTGGERITGQIRVYQPDGRNRVSDWSHEPACFRFIETDHSTLVVNINHVVEIIELEHS